MALYRRQTKPRNLTDFGIPMAFGEKFNHHSLLLGQLNRLLRTAEIHCYPLMLFGESVTGKLNFHKILALDGAVVSGTLNLRCDTFQNG